MSVTEKEVEQVFQTLQRLAKATPEMPDAMVFLSQGGAIALTDRQYIDALLDLANQPTAEEIGAVTRDEVLEKLNADQRGDRYRIRTLLWNVAQQEITEPLEAIVANPAKALQRYGAEWSAAATGRIITLNSFEPGLTNRSVALSRDAAFAYVFLLLVKHPFDTQLRQCQRDACGKFFIDDEVRTGNRLKYCSRKCTEVAEKERARERVKQWRNNQNARRAAASRKRVSK